MMSRKRAADNGPGPIPDRWLHCPRKAFSVIADLFLAFKTPLDSKFDSQVGDEYLFHPDMVFTSARNMKCKIGLWVDLTNTSRFYDKSLVEQAGCKYVKINCRGHGETPNEDAVRTFISICETFARNNPLLKIGVHCTHGFNRTGFLITSYLVSILDWSVEAAVSEFAKTRPPGIYKGEYIMELFQLYGDIDDAPPPPALPMWHSESDDAPEEPEAHQAAEDEPGGSGNGEPAGKKSKRGAAQVKAVFMEGIPNVKPVSDMALVAEIQKRIKHLTGFSSSSFPGCQPVSMDRRNIELLENGYMVSWKADGTRYMMYIRGQYEIFFIDRDNAIFQIEGLSFVSARDRSRHLVDTLVDGEMVIDKAGGAEHPRYLIYDLISLEGGQQMKEKFGVRYRIINKEIIEPRIEAMKEGRIIREREPIGIRRKEFWSVDTTEYLVGERFQKKLGHEPDGLIFQPINDPYKPGTCQEVLKWKPPSHNSVDFRLKIIVEDRPGMLRQKVGQLFVGGKSDVPFDTMKVSKEMSQLDNKIIECTYEITGPHSGKWIFMRQRTDKSFPNSYKTAQAVCLSIREPVTKQYLTDYVRSLSPVTIDEPPRVAMPPPSRPPPHRRP